MIKKPTAKKPTTTAKKAVKKIPQKITDMSLWQLAAEVEDISIKVDIATSVIALIQEAFPFEPRDNVNALWAASDILEDTRKKLDEIVDRLMEKHRETNGIKREKL